MRRFFVLAISALVYVTGIAADANNSLKNANELYSKKNYQKALELYMNLNKSGYESSALYYNTGNAFYKTGDFVKAILFYERALLLDPRNEDIKFNLEVARVNQVDKLDVIPEFFIKSWINSVASVCSSNTWILLSVLSFLGALVLLYFFLFSNDVSRKRTLFGVAMAFVVVSGIVLALANEEHKIHMVRNAAIVMTPSVNAKSSPDDAGTELFVIHEGLKVTVVDKVAGWVKIKLSNGSVGWLKKTDIEVI